MAAPSLILLAEDSDDDACLVRRALQAVGLPHFLVRVTNGVECIPYLKGEPPYDDRQKFPPPHLLLLDLKMPMLSGFDVLAWLKLQSALRHLPVVILSGSIVPEDEVITRGLGAKAYYHKPMDAAAFTSVLRAAATWLAP